MGFGYWVDSVARVTNRPLSGNIFFKVGFMVLSSGGPSWFKSKKDAKIAVTNMGFKLVKGEDEMVQGA
jgi:hypothetical protein